MDGVSPLPRIRASLEVALVEVRFARVRGAVVDASGQIADVVVPTAEIVRSVTG